MAETRQIRADRGTRRRLLGRQAADRLCARASYLPAGDRLVIEQVYQRGLSVTEVARLRGTSPRRMQRRVARLLCRMRQPAFAFVAERGDLLPREVRATARRVVLSGMSLRRTAEATGQTLHQVRQHMRTVQALARI